MGRRNRTPISCCSSSSSLQRIYLTPFHPRRNFFTTSTYLSSQPRNSNAIPRLSSLLSLLLPTTRRDSLHTDSRSPHLSPHQQNRDRQHSQYGSTCSKNIRSALRDRRRDSYLVLFGCGPDGNRALRSGHAVLKEGSVGFYEVFSTIWSDVSSRCRERLLSSLGTEEQASKVGS